MTNLDIVTDFIDVATNKGILPEVMCTAMEYLEVYPDHGILVALEYSLGKWTINPNQEEEVEIVWS